MLLNYQEYGQGHPIIILHGLFGSIRNWQGIARSLTENHRVITVDLRNHGQSPHIDSMSYEEMAQDISFLCNKLKLNDIILMGHSMGGKVAMTTTLNYPEYFSALIVVDIAPVNYTHSFSSLIDAMFSLALSKLKNRNDAEAELMKTNEKAGVIQFILQNLIRKNDAFAWRINLKQISESLNSISEFPDSLNNKSCRLPSLFLGGSESDYLRSIYNKEIFEYFPAAEMRVLDTGYMQKNLKNS